MAVPIAAPSTCAVFREEVDEVVCARTPEPFYAVGLWYEDFTQTTDDEVRDLLRRAREGLISRARRHRARRDEPAAGGGRSPVRLPEY